MFSKIQLTQLSAIAEESSSAPSEEIRVKRPPLLMYRPDGVCEGPGCGNAVPGGMVGIQVEKYFCSKSCQRKEYLSRNVIGICEQCQGPITGVNWRKGKVRFCSRKCEAQFRNERMFANTGPFRKLIEEYLLTTNYADTTNVKGSLTRFFSHVFATEKIDKLEDIGRSVVVRFLAAEKARGMTSSNFTGHLSTFFEWLMDEDRFDKRNPVKSRFRSRNETPRTRQPYEDSQMSVLWRIVEASGITQLKLMFAIGVESGLRNSEVCNIRLSDIDLAKQTIFVRLPTKNGEPRTVPFHNKVKKYLKQWLLERAPGCKRDNLLHNTRLTPFTKCVLDQWFRKLYRRHPEPASSFEFHRLRHTWATRLVNADMELPILQQLGGWKSLRSVQIYAKIRPSTVDRQYEAAYAVIEEKLQSPQEETLSLLDFALMGESEPATPASPAS